MFESNIDVIKGIWQEVLGGETEFFYDIHCSAPHDKKLEFIFPLVAVHETGIYLVLAAEGILAAQHGDSRGSEAIEMIAFACRVFRSYFVTVLPVRSVFLQWGTDGKKGGSARFGIYDCQSKTLRFDDVRFTDDLREYLNWHVLTDSVPPLDEHDELVDRLAKEQAKAEVFFQSEDGSECLMKRGSKWVPVFQRDSQQVYHLALFGGFLGLHRFSLGLFWSGLGYLLTLGLFGAGWIFDCVEMLLGCWQHRGVFLRPLDNRLRNAGKLGLLAIALTGCAWLLFG